MERLIQSAAYDEDFPAEVEDLYIQRVAPALQEIADLVRNNSYLRQLMRAAVGDAKSMLTAVLTMGVAALVGHPDLVAAAFAARAFRRERRRYARRSPTTREGARLRATTCSFCTRPTNYSPS